MDKLIELLNEYELEREKSIETFKNLTLPLWERYLCQWDLVYEPVGDFNWEAAAWNTANYIVISKNYGFIKRLVDNDKIDYEKVDKSWNDEMSFVDFKLDNIMEIRIKVVLMLLAIQDKPIKFLIGILK
jgi:hypothetical protein